MSYVDKEIQKPYVDFPEYEEIKNNLRKCRDAARKAFNQDNIEAACFNFFEIGDYLNDISNENIKQYLELETLKIKLYELEKYKDSRELPLIKQNRMSKLMQEHVQAIALHEWDKDKDEKKGLEKCVRLFGINLWMNLYL